MDFSRRTTGAPTEGYLYEMHQHTAGCSACSSDDPVKTVRQLKAEGFSGMVLTNHFYHGNTGIRRHQEWANFVRPYEEAYELAKAEGQRLDFDVLFGLEEVINNSYKEVLLYGITPTFLYENPQLRDWGDAEDFLPTLSALVHKAGGLLYQAHPCRVRDYIHRPWEELPANLLDGLEGYNACNSPVENARAVFMAQQNGLPIIAGSDSHTAHQEIRYGIIFPQRVRTEKQLVSALQEQRYSLYLED